MTREPIGAKRRPTVEMQHPNHPDHDLTLIAGHAAGDLVDTERNRAQALLDTCTDCATLHRDLIAIAAATRSLPNLATAPRDYRLSPEQAAQLHRGSWLRRALAPFGATRSATRPMAAAFTSLGIAGLLVATILPGMLGSVASAPTGAERDQAAIGAGASAAPAAPAATEAALAPVSGPGQPAPNPTSGLDFGVKDGNTSSGRPATSAPATSAPDVAVAGGGITTEGAGNGEDSRVDLDVFYPSNPLLIGSLAMLAVGLILFGLRFAGRRLR